MLRNFVLETAVNPGQALSVNLAGAPLGRRTFLSQFGAGGLCFYVIDGGAAQEWGLGTVYAGTPNRLERTTVFGNSDGTTARLDFTGTVNLYCDLPAERLPYFNGADTALDLGGTRKLAGLAAGSLAGDGARLADLGFQFIARQPVPGLVASIDLALPAGFTKYRLEWEGLVTGAAGVAPGLRFSTDGGATFLSTTGDYQGFTLSGGTSVPVNGSGALNAIYAVPNVLVASTPCMGWADITPGSATVQAQVLGQSMHRLVTATGHDIGIFGGYRPAFETWNALRLLGSFSAGVVVLSGRRN